LRLTPMAVVEGKIYELVVHPLTAPPEDTWHVLEYSLAAEPADVILVLCTSRKEEEGAEVVSGAGVVPGGGGKVHGCARRRERQGRGAAGQWGRASAAGWRPWGTAEKSL
jgi:hypothetical protein